MKTEYTTNRFKDRDEICRNGELVATYTAANNSTTYAGEGKKYAVPVSKLIKSLRSDDIQPDSREVIKLQQHVRSLQEEIEALKRQIAGGPDADRTTDRYRGIPLNHPDAPTMEPRLGLISPKYLEWARSGGFTEEQFLRVYTGKIKDLSYPSTKS
tara:strand:- start:38651 stop:39118 length:468 start_codon:yes stop_codon:yes gene_type:complete